MADNPMAMLGRALAIHQQWLDAEGRIPAERILADNPELAHLLEPLLNGDAPQEETRERIGDFSILREVGRGGMGVVYEARQHSLQRRVALKVLPAHLTRQAAAVTRFRREALTAAALDHPGLVKVHSVGQDGQTCFYAMEFIAGAPLNRVVRELADRPPAALTGQDLGDAIARHRHRPTAAIGMGDSPEQESRTWHQNYQSVVIELVCQVAEALDYAHREGVVHRDVKPSNILVRSDGTAVLTDFGLARETGVPSMTMTGDFLGTPYYVSPEQAVGRGRELDGRSDIFSLGATLYELLTLHRPFPGSTAQEVLTRIAEGDPVDPRRHHRHLAPDLAAILLKTLARRPAARYATAADLAGDLRNFLACRSVTARRPSLAMKVTRWMRREPLRAALLVVLATGIPTLAWLGGSLAASRRLAALGEKVIEERLVEETLGQAFFYYGLDPERAMALFRRVLELDGANREALLARTALLVDRGDYQEALDLVKRNHQRLAGSRRAARLVEACAKGLDLADAEVPRWDPGDQRQWSSTELFLQGIQDFERAKATTNTTDQLAALQLLRRAAILSPRPRHFFWRELTRLAVVAGYWSRAEEAAAVLQANWPDLQETRLFVALARSRYEREGALAIFARLEEEGLVQDHRYLSTKATSLIKMKLYDRAIAILEKELPSLAESPILAADNCYLIALSHSQLNRREQAIKWYLRATRLHPNRANIHNNLGYQYMQQREWEKAAACFRRALAIEGRFQISRDNLALVHLARREYEEAIRQSRICVKAEPDHPSFRLHLAKALARAGRPEEATECLQPLLYRHDDDRAHACLAMAEIYRDDPALARRWLHQAILADRHVSQAHNNLAINYIRNKEYTKALPHLVAAATLRPEHWPTQLNLVLLYRDLGRPAGAVRHLEWLISRRPDDWQAHSRLATLRLDPEMPAGIRDPAQAVEGARRALELAPPGREWRQRLVLGSALRAAGQEEVGLRELARGRELAATRTLSRADRSFLHRYGSPRK